ncbi:MAG: hypothetical protein NUV53_01845 [Patescibacteria group bacterium]|nr:hypothetical protein [Patescibacteria group bacterium]
MNSEIKNTSVSSVQVCQNCKQQFTIEPEDFDFYKKIGVPPPTWCPSCRNMRRMAWREEGHALYRGTCKLCGKSIITIHAPEGPFTVYCRECYNSDKWDPLSYGREYDFNQPFFTQYRKLMEEVPRPALTGINLVNSEFSHGCKGCKNCYLCFSSFFSENSQHSYLLLLSRNTYDSYVTDNSDHAYETLHSNRLYKVSFGYFTDDCLESAFLFNCIGCSDCFGCVNLRKQKYCVWNTQFSKEEYRKQKEYWDIGSYSRLEEAKKKFRELYLSLPHKYAHVVNSQNVTGDIIRDTKDCQHCFSALDGVQNCKYVYVGGLNLKDSYDVSGGGDTSSLLYEIIATTEAQRCFFTNGSSGSQDTLYCDWAYNCVQVFGCISLDHKKYCILNKQYSKTEYEALKEKIITHMEKQPYTDKKGRVYAFGEYFPAELSAYGYNETFGFFWYPKTKEEVLAEGWSWRDPQKRSYEVTLEPAAIPDHIQDVPDSILKETIGCAHGGTCNEQCTTAFRVTPEELSFYKEMRIALPRLCPNCRNIQRIHWRNGYDLHKRKCVCLSADSASVATLASPKPPAERRSTKGAAFAKADAYINTAAHPHGSESCLNEFETTYSPEKPEIVYCDVCYKAEFL